MSDTNNNNRECHAASPEDGYLKDVCLMSCIPLSSSSAFVLFFPSASDFAAALLESVAFAVVVPGNITNETCVYIQTFVFLCINQFSDFYHLETYHFPLISRLAEGDRSERIESL